MRLLESAATYMSVPGDVAVISPLPLTLRLSARPTICTALELTNAGALASDAEGITKSPVCPPVPVDVAE
jgi:hypothetical protein